MTKTKLYYRILSVVLCMALLVGYIPAINVAAAPLAKAAVAETATDLGTAHSWENMMGADADGNRYAGRVWADKSVYKDGDTAVLNTRGEAGSSFSVSLRDDENFQVVFSVLGSTMASKSTVTSAGPVDVVLVLDTSTSMATNSGGQTRFRHMIDAANALLSDLLELGDVRVAIVSFNADSETIIDLNKYDNGVVLSVNDDSYSYWGGSSGNGVITARDKNGVKLGNDSGYTQGTNLQAGIDRGLDILANAENTEGRAPVAIVLADGRANRAVDQDWYAPVTSNIGNSDDDAAIMLSTLLNAAYGRTRVQKNYGADMTVYGIGIDLSASSDDYIFLNPGAVGSDGFNGSNTSASVEDAWDAFTTWRAGTTATITFGNGRNQRVWTFAHNWPASAGVTTAEIAANINYVDDYQNVSSANLGDAFENIMKELSTSAFNPISSSTVTAGGTGVENTPLIYVDFIGQHMEIKEIQAITLFGSSYGVVKNADGTYTVVEATGTNPTTNELWNTAEDIKISITEETNGVQKLQIRINQEILPIIMERVESETIGDVTTSTITELKQEPLRVFYTVGVDSDILLPNGKVDVSRIQGYTHIDNTNGTVSFYGGQFGVENAADNAGVVWKGDAHVGFKPSAENRYYYHQANQRIFSAVTRKDGNNVAWEEGLYGVVYKAAEYNLTDIDYATYQKYNADYDNPNGSVDHQVYTYVNFWRPTANQTDAANAAELVSYLVYTNWSDLRESVAFYDATSETYLNDGKVIERDQVAAAVDAYKQSNPNAEIYAVLGVDSLRTSRLHNMMVDKEQNITQTAVESYTPEYTHETSSHHNGNDVVVWLGNNGKLTVDVDTGIALTKAVTEAIGDPDDTYALTVTVPAGVVASPVVVDADGNAVASTYSGNVLTIRVKAGQTVYISGIPGGTECAIGEIVDGDYYIANKTGTVRVPLVSEALNGAAQFAPAVVTNAPNKYGDLTIIKDIAHHLTDTPAPMAQKEFTFKVQLSPVPAEGKRTFSVDRANASAFTANTVTVQNDGSFEVVLKDNESITILGLPAGTGYTVTETSVIDGYTNTTGTVSGVIEANGDHDAHFINTYAITPIKPQITVTGQKVLVDVHNTYTANEDFTFVLSQYTGGTPDPYTVLDTQNIKKGESYIFRLDQLLTSPLGLGNHYFRVTEQAGATVGMTYDATRGLFAVHVTDANADGILEYTVEDYANTTINGNTVTKDFTNTYDVTRTHADISITKTLDNNTGVELPLDLFHFVLVNKADANDRYTAAADRSGKATIRVANLAEGTYAYTLSEVNGGMAGMDYDDTVYTVNITVTNNGGVLNAVAEVEGSAQANGDDTLDVSFRNTYRLDPVTHTISGGKVMDTRDPVTDEFEFALYETDSSFVITAAPIDTATNFGKTFAFDEITYTKVGAYYYSVKEIVGNVPGVTYDTTHYHITVHVDIDSADPTKLAVTNVTVNKIGSNSDTSGDVVFVNEYQAAPTQYALGGTKVLHGRAPREGEFTFALYEGNRLLETVTNKADGSFAFKAVSYTEAGTYTYTIKEVPGSVSGVTYDGVNAPVTVTVTVTDTNGVLSAQADIANGNIRFENTYTAKPAQVIFNGNKELKGTVPEGSSFTFKLYETDNTFAIPSDPGKLLDVTQQPSGQFQLERTLSATGTYYFLIVEDATVNTVENVVYDRSQYKFVVKVNDIGDGQLKATITNVITGASASAAASVAADVTFTNAAYDQVTKKEVYMDGNATTQIDGQKVDAGDILTYFITYTNYTGENVVAHITDIIPEYTSYVEGSASHNGTYAGTHVHWNLNVAKGESVTVFFDVRVNETEAIVANTAVVRDGVNVYHTNEVVNHTVEHALEKDVFSPQDVTVSVDGKKVYAGNQLIYKVSFTNTSGKVADIKITDKIPANTTYVKGSVDNGGVYENGAVVWNISAVPAWATVTVSFKVTVNENIGAAAIRNQATATDGSNTYETRWVTNYTVEDEVKKEVFNAEAPAVNIDGKTVVYGETLVYAISYKNTSSEKVTVTITDTVPNGTTYVDGSADNGGVFTEGKITWNVDVPAGATVTVSFKVSVKEGSAAITNKANVVEGKNIYTTNEVSTSVGNPDIPETPQTADNTNLPLWFALLFVSGGGVLATAIYGKKKEETEI